MNLRVNDMWCRQQKQKLIIFLGGQLSKIPRRRKSFRFMNEIDFFLLIPAIVWMKTVPTVEMQIQKSAVTSSNENLERVRLFWAIDYATFYCSSLDVNEPSLEHSFFFGADRWNARHENEKATRKQRTACLEKMLAFFMDMQAMLLHSCIT